MQTGAWRRVLVFLVLTYAPSAIFYAVIISGGKLKALPTFGLMWCPGDQRPAIVVGPGAVQGWRREAAAEPDQA
jgi:hypothetical protein